MSERKREIFRSKRSKNRRAQLWVERQLWNKLELEDAC